MHYSSGHLSCRPLQSRDRAGVFFPLASARLGLCGFFFKPVQSGSRSLSGRRTQEPAAAAREETNQLHVCRPSGNLSTIPVSNISEDARTSHPCERGAGLLRQLSNPQEAGVAKISVLTRRTFSLGGV
jgi:hypothetical protein